MSRRDALWFFFVCCLGLGCSGPSGSEKASVSGSVTLNGAPLDSGLISFFPVDGKGAPASAAIDKGKYTVQVELGEKRVEITAPKVVGKRAAYETPDSPMVDLLEERLPPQYNALTELRATVKQEPAPINFALSADPKN